MKNSAAVPSGAAEKSRDLTKLMPIIFARYLASLTVYVASSQSAPLTHSLPFIRLFSLPIYLAQLPLARFIMRFFVALRTGSCQAVRRRELYGGRPRAFLRVGLGKPTTRFW